MISFSVVINGPVAKAGSILILFSIRGINVPVADAKMITERRAAETLMVSAYESLKK